MDATVSPPAGKKCPILRSGERQRADASSLAPFVI